jgi:cation diffusion facilitator CzcD-associated flavoprotein CzcO
MLSELVRQKPESIEDFDVVIIGSGFAGLGMAIKLRAAGVTSFVILERGKDVGGTWRDNDYPGCACDVQSHLYSFSFEPNPRWSRMFAPQAEIFSYLRHCADKYDVRRHVRFAENVERAEYDERRAAWMVRTSTGAVYRAKALVSAIGALSNPSYPDIAGLERFEGRSFHSALWDHDYELRGKRVAVIGTGASAIQFVPKLAEHVEHLDVYQRTPPWVFPKPDRPISEREQRAFRAFPWLQWLYRVVIYWLLELRVIAFFRPWLMRFAQELAKRHIAKHIADPELRRKVTPDYAMGCKRVLMSDDYYPALAQPNVGLVTTEIREILPHAVVTTDGVERRVDAIVFGTGFRVQTLVPPGLFIGANGRDLARVWEHGLEAYKGTTVAGFPNFFILAGPNTGLGHSSIVFMLESQIAYVLDALRAMREEEWTSVDVLPEAVAAFNARVGLRHSGTVWQSGCRSWYLDARGRNTALWPGFTFVFRRLTARFDARAYAIERGAAASAVDVRTARAKAGEPRALESIG